MPFQRAKPIANIRHLVFQGGEKKAQHVGLTNRDKLVALLGV